MKKCLTCYATCHHYTPALLPINLGRRSMKFVSILFCLLHFIPFYWYITCIAFFAYLYFYIHQYSYSLLFYIRALFCIHNMTIPAHTFPCQLFYYNGQISNCLSHIHFLILCILVIRMFIYKNNLIIHLWIYYRNAKQ